MTHIGNISPMRTEFWMVYGEGQGTPTYKHDSAEAAAVEAERLATRHPGIAFYTLKAKHAFITSSPKSKDWKLTKRRPVDGDDGIPF